MKPFIYHSPVEIHFGQALLHATMAALGRLVQRPGDAEASGDLLWAAAMVWGGLTKIGRGDPDMACHGIEESFSGYFNTHHGACLAVLTPLWMASACGDAPEPFARFARNVMGVTASDDARAAREGIERYRRWLSLVGAAGRFADFGNGVAFPDEGLQDVARTALQTCGCLGRLRPMKSPDEVVALLRKGRDGSA